MRTVLLLALLVLAAPLVVETAAADHVCIPENPCCHIREPGCLTRPIDEPCYIGGQWYC